MRPADAPNEMQSTASRKGSTLLCGGAVMDNVESCPPNSKTNRSPTSRELIAGAAGSRDLVRREPPAVRGVAIQHAFTAAIPERAEPIADHAQAAIVLARPEADQRIALLPRVAQDAIALQSGRSQVRAGGRHDGRDRRQNSAPMSKSHGLDSPANFTVPHRFGLSMISPGTSLTRPVAWFDQ